MWYTFAMEYPVGHEKDVKRVIRKNRIPETFTLARYSFSPYMGCSHGCVYCDGRAEKYFVEGVFERDIVVRRNLPDRLLEELPKLREKGVIAVGSGITDAYQPLEASYRLMRRSAEILTLYSFPVALMTKSDLAMRDLPLWSRIGRNNGLLLMVSLTMTDDTIRQTFEPGASGVAERMALIRAFKEAGCAVGVLAMPLLPGITATAENTGRLYAALAPLNPDFIMPGGLTLRPGRQKDCFMERLAEFDRSLIPLYENLYRENRASGAPIRGTERNLQAMIAPLRRDYAIPFAAPHRLYRNWMPLPDSISILLGHMHDLYADTGVPTKRLDDACRRYNAWLDAEKRTFNRQRSLPSNYVEQQFLAAVDDGTMRNVLANDKLNDFLQPIIRGEACFDFNTLKPSPL